MHRACRSCHAPSRTELPLTDCATCHVPDRAPATLRPLLTERTVSLAVTFGTEVTEAARAPWIEALERTLSDGGLALAPPDHPRTVVVEVAVRLDAGEGRTDAGVAFHAARARAVVTLGRGRIERTGRPAVRTTRDEAATAALESLREPVADAIAW